MNENGYGVVYTPKMLSLFIAQIMLDEINPQNGQFSVLDPACGESFLLEAVEQLVEKKKTNLSPNFYGIDIDNNAIDNNIKGHSNEKYNYFNSDAILPNGNKNAQKYWKYKLPSISAVIANPPWSGEKIYDKKQLHEAGYTLDNGQYDSYVLFVELSIKLLEKKGIAAFILPDSLFSGENRTIRKHLVENTQILCIARLGEKLFPHVNRATSILVVKKELPQKMSLTKCFRLDTQQRKQVLNKEEELYNIFCKSHYTVNQTRFINNSNYLFDIDARPEEEALLRKIKMNSIEWREVFDFGRGVEISKKGDVVICTHCGNAQGYSKKHLKSGSKKCTNCEKMIAINEKTIDTIIDNRPRPQFIRIYVGENIGRYSLNCNGTKFIKLGVEGINYKSPKLYEPPKILVRKTGLGIKASIDRQGTYISQTVYSCNFDKTRSNILLEYYLGLLNSRLIYYYYLKTYGENEWKSHPYITKDILFSLPLRKIDPDNKRLCEKIANLSKSLLSDYSLKIDFELEDLIFQLYDISLEERDLIIDELNKLPDLSAINDMKFPRRDNV